MLIVGLFDAKRVVLATVLALRYHIARVRYDQFRSSVPLQTGSTIFVLKFTTIIRLGYQSSFLLCSR
jgi:hypothetical protein